MFIIIPLALIVLSLIGMLVVVRSKIPYLRKLSPESHEVSDNILHDFFPELMGWLNNIPWHKYYTVSLKELEKALRRMRLVFLKIDHVSARLIQKVRHTHLSNQIERSIAIQPEVTSEVSVIPPMEIVSEPTAEDLKGQEQQLIIEIAQDPKNAGLYEKLGDLYLRMDSASDAKEAFEAGLGFNPNNQALAQKYSGLLKKLEIIK